ncbi:DUF5134 domain-containing protein [Brevibacterium marinum]|uniref:DUF5134 domain-containing protein n=1 Tax=Brevibacterium marinum TaxID=418643 RepID=A0A846RRC9_9MICO|nr:DUF5134 domain-containing protein [Brevibacterium marinum]NJC56309.1 hypothetical protein [Brevibacterium marinum]
MISFPWSLVLTATFAFTGIVCIIHLIRHWRGSTSCSDVSASRMDMVVHGNHLVMSIGMILMVWTATGTVATWSQVAFFAILAVLMGIGLRWSHGAGAAISLSSHIVLNASMVWMLLAMPLLMGHGMTMSPTPGWTSALNWVAIALSTLAAVWWIVLLVRSRRVGIHTLCHAAMGLGMAAMLILM